MLILIVAEGPDKGRIYEWTDDQTVIVGRESKDLRLSDGKASRQHARFKCEGGTWSVRDLASRHGTLVNNIRTDGKTALRDGDRVRVGRTELVVARMPAEQAERAALIGGESTHSQSSRDVTNRRWYIPRASTAAAFTAAAFAVGCSVWLYMQTTDANDMFRGDILASQDKAIEAQRAAADAQAQATESQLAIADRTDLILGEVKALGTTSTPVLNEILASVQSQDGNNALLGDIHQALAEMHNSSMTTLDTILAGVESQSAQWRALAQVQDSITQQQTDTALLLPELETIAATARANENVLSDLKIQIEQAQARPDLDAKVLDQLEAVVAELQARPTLDQVTDGVRNALAAEQKKTDVLLTRIEGQLAASPDTQALIAPLRETLSEQVKATEQLVAKAFEQQELTTEQLEGLKTLVQSQPNETATALSDVINKLDTQDDINEVLAAVKRIEAGSEGPEAIKLLSELASKLESAPTSEQLADTVALAVTTQLNETRPLLEQIADSLDTASQQSDFDELLAVVKRIESGTTDAESIRLLNELALKLESAPSSQQLADAVAQAVNSELSDTRPLLEQIASSLNATSQQNATGQELIEKLRLALLAQEAADTRLDQIYDLLASAEATGEDSEALKQVLREIRSKSIAGMDELRSTIRRELQAGLTDQRLAGSRTTTPLPLAEPESLMIESDPVMDEQPGGTVAMAAQVDPGNISATENPAANSDGMTDVEHAYRLAFKTGKPITLGGGSIDPKTGKASQGRTLDPSAAKAAGITDWRDWYLMDDFAERMRLQQQAIQFHDGHRGPNLLSIPADAQTDLKIDRRGSGG